MSVLDDGPVVVDPVPEAFRLPPLVDPATVGDWTTGVAAGDPRVEPLVLGASAGVRRYCGWHVAPVLEETLTVDGPGSSVAFLPSGRLVDVLAVESAGDVVNLDDVDVSVSGLVEWRAGRFTGRLGRLRLRVRHGYDVEDVEDLCGVVRQVVAVALSSPMGATREQAGQLAVSWATTAPGVSGGLTLLERDRAILDRFRIV